MTTRTLDRVVALRASLCCQVVCAVIAGVALGHYYPAWGAEMKPLGDGFIKLIKMIITPIIFCTVVIGIAGMDDIKKVGRTGGLALLCFALKSSPLLHWLSGWCWSMCCGWATV